MDREEVIRQVLDALIGKITPAGDTHIDHERYENLDVLESAINHLLDKLSYVVGIFHNSGQCSVKNQYEKAKEILELIAENIKGILE